MKAEVLHASPRWDEYVLLYEQGQSYPDLRKDIEDTMKRLFGDDQTLLVGSFSNAPILQEHTSREASVRATKLLRGNSNLIYPLKLQVMSGITELEFTRHIFEIDKSLWVRDRECEVGSLRGRSVDTLISEISDSEMREIKSAAVNSLTRSGSRPLPRSYEFLLSEI